MVSMEFPEKLEMLLERSGSRASDVARRAGLPPQRLTEWKDPRSGRKPTAAQAFALARALGVTADYLLDDAQDDPPAPEVPADIVALIRAIGPELARRRLLALPEPAIGPVTVTSPDQPSYGDVKARRKTS